MKKLLSVLMVLVLVFTACSKPEEPVVEPPGISVSDSSKHFDSMSEPDELFVSNKAAEIYGSEMHVKYLSLINERIKSYKNGTFEELENHHGPYPENFPPANELPKADESNVLLGWKDDEYVEVEYVYIIDQNHAIIFEPIELVMNGETTLGFGNTSYLNEDVVSWISRRFDGFFGEPSENISSEPEKKFSIEDIDTSVYDEVKDYGFMYVLTKTEGTKTGLVHDEEFFSSIGEVPNEQVWLLLKNGEFINEEPFYDVRTYGGNINAPDEHWVTVCRDGAQHSFYVNEKTFEIYGEETILPSTEKVFDFNLETYYWISRYPSYGVTAADDTVICEKHYGRLSIPFPDRILAADKATDMWSSSHNIIFDEKGNIINSSYNHIRFSVLNEGYIGVAYCADPATTYDYEFYQCYDGEGNPMPGGYWLIDKNGKPVSERYDYLYINKEWQLFAESKDDIVYAVTEDGKEVSFKVEEILLKETQKIA